MYQLLLINDKYLHLSTLFVEKETKDIIIRYTIIIESISNSLIS